MVSLTVWNKRLHTEKYVGDRYIHTLSAHHVGLSRLFCTHLVQHDAVEGRTAPAGLQCWKEL